jgi:hypothetical protein
MAAEVVIGHHVVQELMESLGSMEVCVFWILHVITEEHILQAKKSFHMIAGMVCS